MAQDSNNLVLKRYAPVDAQVDVVTPTHYYLRIGLRPVAIPKEQVFEHTDMPITAGEGTITILISEWACDKLNINFNPSNVITTGRTSNGS